VSTWGASSNIGVMRTYAQLEVSRFVLASQEAASAELPEIYPRSFV